MPISDLNKNFTPGAGTSFNTRGAYSFVPAEGSSNILGGGIQSTPIADKYMAILNDPTFQKLPEADKTRYWSAVQPSETTSLLTMLSSPEWQSQQDALQEKSIQRGLAAYKQMGDEQMKYNLINRGLTALQTGIERGLTKYQDPYSIANMIANGYAEGARSSAGLAQIGQGMPARNYYRV